MQDAENKIETHTPSPQKSKLCFISWACEMKTEAWVMLKSRAFVQRLWKGFKGSSRHHQMFAQEMLLKLRGTGGELSSGVRWRWDQKEVDSGERWEVLVPEPGLGNGNDKDQKSLTSIWGIDLPGLLISYSWDQKEERWEGVTAN